MLFPYPPPADFIPYFLFCLVMISVLQGIFYNEYNQQKLDTPEILTALLLLVLPAYFLIPHLVAIPNSTRKKHTVQFHSSAH